MYSIPFAKRERGLIGITNLSNLGLSELGAGVSFAYRAAALLSHIFIILINRAKPEMIGTNAPSVITGMENQQAIWYRAIVNRP